MKRLDILIGMIGSGKSTFCKEQANMGAIILNDDSIVTSLHGGIYTKYNESLKPLYRTIEDNAIIMSLALDKRVVIDRTNLDAATRMRYILMAKSFNAPVYAYLFKIETPEIHAERRFISDSRGVTKERWLEIATIHLSKYTPPSIAEGFKEIVYL